MAPAAYAARGLDRASLPLRLSGQLATRENGSPQRASRVLRIEHGRVDRVVSPRKIAQVKAVACEPPKTHGVALSRFSRSELHRFVVEQAVSDASASTIGRWLADDAIRPWQHRPWIFPRDPSFLEKAAPVLDLYAGRWDGKLLEPGDMVISADAKPSIQARERVHPSAPPAPGARSARRARIRTPGRPDVTSMRGTSGAAA